MSKLIIHNFDKLSESTQEDLEDVISGYTPDFTLFDTEDKFAKAIKVLEECTEVLKDVSK